MLWGVAALALGAQFTMLAFYRGSLNNWFNITALLFMAVAKTLRERQLEDHDRDSESTGEEDSPGSDAEHTTRRSNALSPGTKVVLFVELALVLAGGALHLLQIEGAIGFGSVTATTLLLAGSATIAFGILLHSTLRRLRTPEKRIDAATALGVLAAFPLLCWLGHSAGRWSGTCLYQHSDGSKQDYTCFQQESGEYLLVDDIGSYLGWPVLGAAAMFALFIAAAFAIGIPDRGNRTILRWNLICAVLVSALLATILALDIADVRKAAFGWPVLAALIVILPAAVHAIRRRVRLERMRKAGTLR